MNIKDLKMVNEQTVKEAKQKLFELEQHCGEVERCLHFIKDVDSHSWQAYIEVQGARSVVANALKRMDSICYIDYNYYIHVGKVVKKNTNTTDNDTSDSNSVHTD